MPQFVRSLILPYVFLTGDLIWNHVDGHIMCVYIYTLYILYTIGNHVHTPWLGFHVKFDSDISGIRYFSIRWISLDHCRNSSYNQILFVDSSLSHSSHLQTFMEEKCSGNPSSYWFKYNTLFPVELLLNQPNDSYPLLFIIFNILYEEFQPRRHVSTSFRWKCLGWKVKRCQYWRPIDW